MARREPAEYRFKIDAYSPASIPMVRLAHYMATLAEILGEEGSVHFDRLEPGSTVLVHRIEPEAVPKVIERTTAVRLGEGPREAREAYRKANRLLREDDARAVFRKGERGTRILEFPGTDLAEEPFPSIKQFATLSGIVARVGGTGDQIPVALESEGVELSGLRANRTIAKALAQRLFEPVRVAGKGAWMRDAEGVWSLKQFQIDSFEELKATPLSGVLADIRYRAPSLRETTYEDLVDIRHGRVTNGGD